jgi:thiol-disulfide isomerase/thioredoxin
MKGSLFRIRFVGLTMAALLLFACGDDGGKGGTAGHRPAPDFALKDLQGGILRLEDFRGKVVILNFFATWCAPCRQEVPELIQLRKKFLDEGLEIVGISLDMEGATVLKPFARHFRIPYPIVIGTRDVVSDYGGIEGVPTTFFVDREGFIVNRVIGLVPRQRLEQAVASLL